MQFHVNLLCYKQTEEEATIRLKTIFDYIAKEIRDQGRECTQYDPEKMFFSAIANLIDSKDAGIVGCNVVENRNGTHSIVRSCNSTSNVIEIGYETESFVYLPKKTVFKLVDKYFEKQGKFAPMKRDILKYLEHRGNVGEGNLYDDRVTISGKNLRALKIPKNKFYKNLKKEVDYDE